eukprot:PITA_11960
MEAPTLISPDYSREFHIFSFASNDTIATVLLQVDEEGSEHPVAIFSKTLRDAELRYDMIEKHAYALIKSLKAFRVYIHHSKVIAYVPSAVIKGVLTQPDADGRRAKWIAKLIEFNIKLKPTKLVRGQGLAILLAEENCRTLDINLMCLNSENGQTEEEITAEPERKQSVAENLASCDWYSAIIKFLLKLEIPLGSSTSQARTITLRSAKYCINENLLYWRDPSGVVLRCLDKEQSIEVMQQFHSSMCGDTIIGRLQLIRFSEQEAVFPIQLTLPVARFLQTEQNEEEDMAKRITDLAKVHQIREQLVKKVAAHQKKIKEAFDKKTKSDNFQVGELVLKWDALKEKKGNHGKFDAFWACPFIISQIQGNNTFLLQSMG